MHHNRHKEILTLIRKINIVDEVHNAELVRSDSLSTNRSRRGSAQSSTTSTTTASEFSADYGDEVAPKMRRSERKKAKRLGLCSTNKEQKIEAFSKEDIDFVSEAIHLAVHETKGGWHDTYVYPKMPPQIEKSIFGDQDVADIGDHLAFVIARTPSTPAMTVTPRERRIAKKSSVVAKHRIYSGGSRRSSPKGLSNDILDGLDPEIFFRLNIDVNPARSSMARKELVTKLVAIIKNDLAVLAHEAAESEMRAEGFRRWAGKTVWAEIMQKREKLDWVCRPQDATSKSASAFSYRRKVSKIELS